MSVLELDGCRLEWTRQGTGPPVLFIQGTGVHGQGWLPQVDGLADRYTCIFFDNRGMGQSQPAARPITLERMADDAAAVLSAAGFESAHVVGHSLGGLIAIALALRAPERVRSLALLCTFARGADVTRLTWEGFWRGLRTYVGTRRMRRHAFLEMVMPPAALAEADRDELAARLEPLFGHDLAVQPPIVFKQLGAMKAYDASGQLGNINKPTWVIVAGRDLVARPEFGRALAAGIPGARLIEFPEAGHGLPLVQPAEINNLLGEFFAMVETEAAVSGRRRSGRCCPLAPARHRQPACRRRCRR